MDKISWILMNIDNTQIDLKEDKIIENSELRRSVNYLMDNNVKFTIISRMHSTYISKFVKGILIPNNDTFIISSYGSEIYSFKKNKVINRVLIKNKFIKNFEQILERINFDFCKKIFIEIHEKNGFVYLLNNNYKNFNTKVNEFEINNKNIAYEVINSIKKNSGILNSVITFFEEVDIRNLIVFLTKLDSNFSYKMIDKNKLLITSIEAGVGICMDIINSNKNFKFNKKSIMSFSDSIIDIPLFKKSSISITIDSSSDELKKVATNVFVGVEKFYINEFLKKEING